MPSGFFNDIRRRCRADAAHASRWNGDQKPLEGVLWQDRRHPLLTAAENQHSLVKFRSGHTWRARKWILCVNKRLGKRDGPDTDKQLHTLWFGWKCHDFVPLQYLDMLVLEIHSLIEIPRKLDVATTPRMKNSTVNHRDQMHDFGQDT